MNANDYPSLARRGTPAARRETWWRRAPVFGAALLGLPLLVLSLLFSYQMGSVAFYMFRLGGFDATLLGIILLSLLGVAGLVGYLACLFIGWRKDSWHWRIGWSIGAVLCSAALPLSWILLGWT